MTLLALFAAAFAVALACLLRFRHATWTATAAALATLLFLAETTTWIASDRFTGEGVNSAVVFHLRVGFDGAGMMEYAGIVVFCVIGAVLAVALAAAVWHYLARGAAAASGAPAVAALGGLFLLVLLHPTANGLLGAWNRAVYGEDSLLAGLPRSGETAAEFADYYVSPSPDWDDAPPLNLVVLYAESLERTYFDEERFPGLIRELRDLESQAISYTNIRNAAGTGFTIAGLVASQCGMPLVTSGHPNSMRGMDRFLPGAVCIGDLLRQRGYDLSYLGGARLSFAGKGTFFESHGFDTVLGFEELQGTLEDPAYASTWGLYDDALLDRYLARFEALSDAKEPFALFGLTMDTHHPSGHRSRRCGDLVYGDGSNRMLNAVHCADRLLAQAIRRILASPAADRTLLVVASDHVALKNDVWEQLRAGERRNLLWFFPPGGTPQRVDVPGTTIDTPALISHYLGASLDAFGLGRNLAAGRDSLVRSLPRINRRLREWRDDFADFWQLPEAIDALRIDAQGQRIAIGERDFAAPALLTIDDGTLASIRFAFDSRTSLDSYVRKEDDETVLVWVDECRRVRAMSLRLPRVGACVFAGAPGRAQALTTVLDGPLELSAGELAAFAAAPAAPSLLATRQRNLDALAAYGDADARHFEVALPVPAASAFAVQSTGGPGTRSLVRADGEDRRLPRGLHLFAIGADAAVRELAHVDPCAGEVSSTASFARHIEEERQAGASYLIVASDSATCGQPLDDVFAGLALSSWAGLELREPYVALIPGGADAAPIEMIGDAYTSLWVDITPAGTQARAPVASQDGV